MQLGLLGVKFAAALGQVLHLVGHVVKAVLDLVEVAASGGDAVAVAVQGLLGKLFGLLDVASVPVGTG